MQENSGFFKDKLKINFDALDDAILNIQDFQFVLTNFKAGVWFWNAFKMLKN